jgi:hypothetical protein
MPLRPDVYVLIWLAGLFFLPHSKQELIMRLDANAVKLMIAVVLLFAAAAAHASITVFSQENSFLATLSAPGIDDFSGLSGTPAHTTSVNSTAGSYDYTAIVGPDDGIDMLVTPSHVWLSTISGRDSITFTDFTGGVRGFGGFFFGTDLGGNSFPSQVVLTATDHNGTITQILNNATTSSFLGFVSDTALYSVTVRMGPASNDAPWPTIGSVILGAVAPTTVVPEPSIYITLLGGLMALTFKLRRRPGPSTANRAQDREARC